MKSRQINFYLTQHDQVELEERVLESAEWLPVAATHTGKMPKRLQTTLIHRMGDERLQIFVCHPSQYGELVSIDVPDQRYKLVDVVKSPAIEFARCFSSGKKLRRGRFYYVSRYFDDEGKIVAKDDKFLRWAEGLFKISKKALILDEQGMYLGQEAYEFRKDLEFLP